MIIDVLLKQTSGIQAKKLEEKFWGNFEQQFWIGVVNGHGNDMQIGNTHHVS